VDPDDAIRTPLDESAAEYCQRLGRLLDGPDAAEFAPVLVCHLRRQRDRRWPALPDAGSPGDRNRERRERLRFDPESRLADRASNFWEMCAYGGRALRLGQALSRADPSGRQPLSPGGPI
jgi:Protein of unknown function (DUF3263)